MYKRLCIGVGDKGRLIPVEQVQQNIINRDLDHYQSIYDYTEAQYQAFKKTQSIKGVVDVSTQTLIWDFDAEDIELARKDADTLVARLHSMYDIPYEGMLICFSGNKGFHVHVDTTYRFTVDEFKAITWQIAKDLPTYDTKINNPSRILRVTNTKHQVSGLFKIPLTEGQLHYWKVDKIRQAATSKVSLSKPVVQIVPSPKLIELKNVRLLTSEAPAPQNENGDELSKFHIDFNNIPKGFAKCKWALANGFRVEAGDRHDKLMCVIATCRSLNFSKNQTYYLAKNAMKEGARVYGHEECSKEDIWRDINSVYSPGWNGGTYSCKDGKTLWLTELCSSLKHNSCKHQEKSLVSVADVYDMFANFAGQIETNTLKTGLQELDDQCKFMVGTSNAILAPPAVGKSSLAFEILAHNSKNNISSIFFSYDMYHAMVYQRLLQRYSGWNTNELYDMFKHQPHEVHQYKAQVEQGFKNVNFCFKTGQTPEQIVASIKDTQELTGNKVKLIIIDYNELVHTNISDSTQSSAYVAQKLREIANEEDVCVLTLLQPSKLYANPADEMTTYQAAKGSSAIAQSMSLMLSMSRPGFNPRTPEDDKYLIINALKNRNGPLFSSELSWCGVRGTVSTLSDEGKRDLAELKAAKEAARIANSGRDWN